MLGFNCDVLWNSCVKLPTENVLMNVETDLHIEDTPPSVAKSLILCTKVLVTTRTDVCLCRIICSHYFQRLPILRIRRCLTTYETHKREWMLWKQHKNRNPLKPVGNYVPQLLQQSLNLRFALWVSLRMIFTVNWDYFLTSISHSIFVMVKCFLFTVPIKFLNIIWRSFSLKGLIMGFRCW
jgi:hypothetical protein